MTSPSILFHGDIRGEKTFYNNLNELYRNIFFIRNKNKRTKKKKKTQKRKNNRIRSRGHNSGGLTFCQ